jgi:hypothetical protein
MTANGPRDGHREALDEAWSRLSSMELRAVAPNAGASLKPGSPSLVLRVMDGDCLIDLGGRKINYCGRRTGPPGHHLQILILHYLQGAGNAQLANKHVTYRDFEGGALYYSAFKARTIDPLVKEFGQKPDLLKHVGDAMHAETLKLGSVGFKVNFFPKMPVTIILWLGDDEVAASANLLFDANAGRILPTEDLSVLGGALVTRIRELARA